MIKKIISGGQTGADRAALDVAIKMGYREWWLDTQGSYQLKMGHCLKNTICRKCPLPAMPKRTEQNVIESDGTLIICRGKPTGGSDLHPENDLKTQKAAASCGFESNNFF